MIRGPPRSPLFPYPTLFRSLSGTRGSEALPRAQLLETCDDLGPHRTGRIPRRLARAAWHAEPPARSVPPKVIATPRDSWLGSAPQGTTPRNLRRSWPTPPGTDPTSFF